MMDIIIVAVYKWVHLMSTKMYNNVSCNSVWAGIAPGRGVDGVRRGVVRTAPGHNGVIHR